MLRLRNFEEPTGFLNRRTTVPHRLRLATLLSIHFPPQDLGKATENALGAWAYTINMEDLEGAPGSGFGPAQLPAVSAI